MQKVEQNSLPDFEMKVKNRVKDTQTFQLIYKTGKQIRTDCLSLYYLPSGLGYIRIGISVPTKSGNAVIRNKIKRQIRALIAKHCNLNQSVDAILLVRKAYSVDTFDKTEKDLLTLLKKVGNIE